MPRVLFGVTVAMTAQAFLRDQLSALAQQGWDVHLACSDEDGTDSFHQLSQMEGVTLHRLPMSRGPNPLRDALSLWSWLRLIRSLNPDLVVSSTPKAGLLGSVASWMSGIGARVYHVRGLRAEGLVGVLAVISRLSERIATTTATHVLVDSHSLLQAMRCRGLLPDSKGQVLGSGSSCGVDTDYFRPPTSTERQMARQAIGMTDDDVVIGFLGRLAIDKGIRELIDATQLLQGESSQIKLVLVGPVETSARLGAHLNQLASSDWALVLERTNDPRLMYWAFDIFCLPSYREGFPIASLEAQACGLPVVTTNATGCVDSIDHRVTGLCVPTGDRELLSEALTELVSGQTVRWEMGAAGRERVIQEFSRSVVTPRLASYLDNSLTPTPRTSKA